MEQSRKMAITQSHTAVSKPECRNSSQKVEPCDIHTTQLNVNGIISRLRRRTMSNYEAISVSDNRNEERGKRLKEGGRVKSIA